MMPHTSNADGAWAPHWEHVLRDGTRVIVRAVRPSDSALLRAGFDRLSPASRYRRFLNPGMKELSEKAVRYLTDVDGWNHVAIAAAIKPDDHEPEEGLGIARFIRLPDEPEVAEAAVTVIDSAQRKGLGRFLSSLLVERAREVGIKCFRAFVLNENEPMIRLLEDAGATMRANDHGVGVFDVPLDGVICTTSGEPRFIDRILRAAASSFSVLLHNLHPPASAEQEQEQA